MREIVKNSFYLLSIVYTIAVVIISLKIISRYTLHFEILAIIIGTFGISIVAKEQDSMGTNMKLEKFPLILLIFLGSIFIVITRIVPYLNNSIPLGYDAGLYKYGIEYGLENLDRWILRGGMEPGFLYLMKPLTFILTTEFILKWLFIGFCLVLGFSVYLTGTAYFGKRVGIIAFLIYGISVVQYKVFSFMYYKNIIGLSLMMFALYFLKKETKYAGICFIIISGMLGAVHRPTFYLFGLSYLLYVFLAPLIEKKKYEKSWLAHHGKNAFFILIITSLFYIGKFRPAIIEIISPVLGGFLNPGESPGTFISFHTYQFAILPYLPFAILGFFYLVKKKEYNIIQFWAVISAIIVYFQFFFYNRFIIHLDMALIILAAVGFSVFINNKKVFGTSILVAMILSSSILVTREAREVKPLIDEEALQLIEKLDARVEKDAKIMALSSEHAPWVLGYAKRKTIAPGLFDENLWGKDEWGRFWQLSEEEKEKTKKMLEVYGTPLYMFSGTRIFNNPCFEVFLEEGRNRVYKYVC